MYWTYKTNVGTFWIKPNRNNMFTLGIDDEALGSFSTPENAASDVYSCATGYWPWDKRLITIHPEDLSEWHRHE